MRAVRRYGRFVSPFDLAIDAAALAWILYRQRRVRRVRLRLSARPPIVLLLVGLVQFVHFTDTHSLGGSVTGVTIASCIVAASLFGAARGTTMRLISISKGVAQQAGWVTMALWAASVGAHFALSAFVDARHGPLDVLAASLLLYLAVSLGAQNVVVQRRAIALLRRGGADSGRQVFDVRSWEGPAS